MSNKSSTGSKRIQLLNKKRRRWIKQHRALCLVGSVGILIVLCLLISQGVKKCCDLLQQRNENGQYSDNPIKRPDLDVELLTVNPYSRPGIALENINGIVIHYTANPGSSARQNRDYFEELKNQKTTKASSHFIVGLDGEIVQCIPSSEISYASNDRNTDTISIECCHPDETGKFNDATYKSLVHLTAWLCLEFDVSPDNVIRHYDVTGKNCPKYFVENEDKWEKFIQDVKDYIKLQ